MDFLTKNHDSRRRLLSSCHQFLSVSLRLSFWILLGTVLPNGCARDDDSAAVEQLRQRQRKRDSVGQSSKVPLTQRLKLVTELLDEGKSSDAKRELRPLLVSEPENPHVIVLGARCDAASGDRLSAIETISAVKESDIDAYAGSCWFAAVWLQEEGSHKLAQAKLEAIIDHPRYRNRVRHKLASLLEEQGLRHAAAVHLRALARSGDINEKELFALIGLSDAFIDDSMQRSDSNTTTVPGTLVRAMKYRSEGETDKAIELTEKLSEKFPESSAIRAFQGRMYAESQLLDSLKSWLHSLPSCIEDEPDYWFAIGAWFQSQGQFDQAIRCYCEVVHRDETDRSAYLSLARCLASRNQQEAADQAFRRFRLLDESVLISRKIGLRSGTLEELARLSEILDDLNRPWEAVSWKEAAIQSHGGSKREVSAVRAQRENLESQSPDNAKSHFVTCGLDLSDWPLDASDLTMIKPSNFPRSRDSRSLSSSPIRLVEIASDAGLDFQYLNGANGNVESYLLHQVTGGGIGVIDFDQDGWPDVYMCQGGGNAFDATGSQPNQLFRNLEGKKFVAQTNQTGTGDLGYSQGVAVADINQDGFADLIVANIGDNLIYRNQGDGTFSSQILRSDAEPGMWTTSIACGDLSGDHLPEIVEVNYVDDPMAMKIACTPKSTLCNPSTFEPAVDRVWQISAEGAIRRWNGCTGIEGKPNYGFAAVIGNFDNAAGNDLFIANDTKFNHYWVSRKLAIEAVQTQVDKYSLSEDAVLRGCAAGLLGQRNGSMGVAYGDMDNNGFIDLHVTNFWDQASDLYLQQESGSFVNGCLARGLFPKTRATVGWGTQAIDFQRDGWLDLLILNGHTTDHRQRGVPYQMLPQLFQGSESGFALVDANSLGDAYWSTLAMGRTAAILDWNRDGRSDLLTNHLDQPTALLENRTEAGNGVQFELIGTQSERDAIGAVLQTDCEGVRRTAWVVGGDGFLCSNESLIEIGLGDALKIDRLLVIWPAGNSQEFGPLEVNQRYLIVENEAIFDTSR